MNIKDDTTTADNRSAANRESLAPGRHTPGPWEEWRSLSDNSLNVCGAECAFVCEVGKIGRDDYNDDLVRADARLIAAAPDLLNALVTLASVAEARGIPADAARAAIAKATGR